MLVKMKRKEILDEKRDGRSEKIYFVSTTPIGNSFLQTDGYKLSKTRIIVIVIGEYKNSIVNRQRRSYKNVFREKRMSDITFFA